MVRLREIGRFFDIVDYEFNYASFWLLDILAKFIKHMQLQRFSVNNQNICLTWFRFVIRCISISGDSREKMFSLLQEMFLKAEQYIKAGNSIPQPEEIDISERKSTKLASILSSKSLPSISSRQSRKKLSQKSSRLSRNSSLISRVTERSLSSSSSKSYAKLNITVDNQAVYLRTLYMIIEMIYKVFADRFMFSLISQAYSSPTIVTPVEVPIDFKDPKQIRPTLVVTPPESPKSNKPSVSKSGKKTKEKGKGKRKGSPTSGNETVGDNGDKKTSKKGKSKEKTPLAKKSKEGKGKKKSKPSSSSHQEEVVEIKGQTEQKSKEKGRKSKNISKSSEDTKIEHTLKTEMDIIKNTETSTFPKSSSLEKINYKKIEEKLELFKRTMTPEMKLEKKKIEVKDKFLLPLTEGATKDYVDNLIKSLLPPETKPTESENVLKEKSARKSRKSSSLKGKKKKSLKPDKKAKGKKK